MAASRGRLDFSHDGGIHIFVGDGCCRIDFLNQGWGRSPYPAMLDDLVLSMLVILREGYLRKALTVQALYIRTVVLSGSGSK